MARHRPPTDRQPHHPDTPGTIGTITATLLLLIMVGGCTRTTPDQPPVPPSEPAPAPSSAPADLPANVPTDLGDPIMSASYDDGHNHRATLELYPLRRFDADTVQTWALIRRDPSAARDVKYASLLTRAWNHLNNGTNQPDGFALFDAEHQRLHVPMHHGFDSRCTPALTDLDEAVEQAYVTCLFGRPATDRVEIHVQNFGSISDVPVP